MTFRGRSVCAVAVSWALCLPAGAAAADRIYAANERGSGNPLVSFANLDGSGGGDLVPGAAGDFADGVAIDAAAGRLYYGRTTSGEDKISFVNLDGSGRGDLPTPGATVTAPNGLAIDPAAGMLYWASYGTNQIGFARLDGGGAGFVNTAPANVNGPIGVAIDPAAGRIYWANNGPGADISFANLNGTGGANLNTAGATSAAAWGVALDVAGGRIYWGNDTVISFARLDGTGGADLMTAGATVASPGGAAIDVPAGRIYWPNTTGDTFSFAALDGSGGGNLATAGASFGGPSLPALLKRPAGAGLPAVTGGSKPKSALSCSRGAWAPDLLGASLYRAPAGFAFQWSRDGVDLPGATTGTLTADKPGSYRCTVTASNFAGGSTQTSEAHRVALPTFGAKTLVTLTLAAKRIPARGPVKVKVRNRNGFAVRGRLRIVKQRAKRFRVGARAGKTVKLKLPKPLGQRLVSNGQVKLRLAARVTDPAGKSRTVRKRVAPKLKR
jgi:hypothetical protein